MTPAEHNKRTGSNTLASENINLSDVTYSQSNADGDSNSTIITASHTEIHSGPLPAPRLLKEYDQVISGGAERIMAMAEKQQESRIEGERETREINRQIAEQQLKLQRRGQTIGFIVVLIVLALVVLFAFTGHEAVVYGLLAISLAGLISSFMGVKHKKHSDK